MTEMTAESRSTERFEITRKVTLVGAVVNLLLSIIKIVIGIIATSQSLVADGIHSFSDLLSDALVYIAAKHASQDPDPEHPYGHGRFETAATLGLGILLILVAVGIAWDAANRLFAPEELLQPTAIALYAAIISILSKELLYHYTVHGARKIRSEMMMANAWHHRSDAVSSIVVLVGIGGTMAGLPYLDAIAAIGVGLMIAHIGWELCWPALQELMDTGLEEEHLQNIKETILSIGGVRDIHMLRTRKLGVDASVDVHVLVDSRISVSEGHLISQTVIDRLLENDDAVSDVTVHIDPEDDEVAAPCKGLPLRREAEQLIARAWSGLGMTEQYTRLLFHYLDGKVDVELYLPLDAYAGEAESRQLEHSLRQAIEPLQLFRRVSLFYGEDAP